MGNAEALKGDENVVKGGREVSKSDDKTLNCGDEALRGDEDAEGRRKGIHVRPVTGMD